MDKPSWERFALLGLWTRSLYSNIRIPLCACEFQGRSEWFQAAASLDFAARFEDDDERIPV